MTRGKHSGKVRPNIKDMKHFEASDLEKITRDEAWKYFSYQILCGWHKQPLFWKKTEEGQYMFVGGCAITGQQCIYKSPFAVFVADYVCGYYTKGGKKDETSI